MSWTLVTGGAKGLGSQICKTLAESGHNILIHYRGSEEAAEQVAEECREFGVLSKTIAADFSTQEGVLSFVAALKQDINKIKFLINNVGNFFKGSSLETPIDQWYELFQTNLHTPFLLIQGLLPLIVSERGSIINIGSVGAKEIRAEINYTAYSLTKKSLYLLTASLAKELAKDGVRVNMVSPGELENSVTLKAFFKKLPMKRPGTLKEVAEVVRFLLRDDSSYITGQNIEVAGGFAL